MIIGNKKSAADKQIERVYKEFQAKVKKITEERDKTILGIIKKIEARQLKKVRASLK